METSRKDAAPASLADLTTPAWPDPCGGLWRMGLELRNDRNTLAKSHPLFVLRAILLSAIGLPVRPLDPSGLLTWRPHGPVGQRIRQGGLYRLWVLGRDPAWLEALAENMAAWLGDSAPKGPRNFSLTHVSPPEQRSWATLWAEHTASLPVGEEICLDFHTPLAFTPEQPQQRWRLGREEFLRLLETRAQTLGLPALDTSTRESMQGLEVRPWFWEFHRHTAVSQSARKTGRGKTEEPLCGCLGPLYLRGPWPALLPWLVVAAEVGLGKRLSLGQGTFRLLAQRPFFDPELANPSRYVTAYEEAREGGLDFGLRDLAPSFTDSGSHSPANPGLPATDALARREEICANLALDFRRHSHTPGPVDFLPLRKKDGVGERRIALLPVADKIFQRTLHAVLSPVCDRQLEPSAHGFRPGLGVESARAALAEAMKAGATWVVETDLADFFDQIPWDGLDAALHRALPVADVATRAALRAVYRRADSPTPGRGLLQGSPLSPLLANLYLDRLDETLAAEGWRPVRYGDDLIVPATSQEEAARALARLEELVGQLGLSLKSEKTSLTPTDAGFTFLGRPFGSGLEEEALAEQVLRHTVYVTEGYAMVGLDHEALVVKKGGALLSRVPLARVEAIVIHGTHVLSTPLLMACARRRIPITFAGVSGYTVNVLRPDSRAYFDRTARHAARHTAQSPHDLMGQAGAIVQAKVHNTLAWLSSRREPSISAPLPALRDLASRAASLSALPPEAANPKLPLGLEGAAAALTYPLVNSLALDPAWRSSRRSPREKSDPWNALLDFGANLLFARLNAMIRSAGLNPYLGWLHSAGDSYESLVCDLMEPFRPRLERWLIKTVNRQAVTPAHLEKDSQGRWRFTKEGSRQLIESWERELQIRLTGDPGTFAEILHSQVALLVRWALSEAPHLPLFLSSGNTKSND